MEKESFCVRDALTFLRLRTEGRSRAEGRELELLQGFFQKVEEAKFLARELLTETKEKGVTCTLRPFLKDEAYWSSFAKVQEEALESIIHAFAQAPPNNTP